ncbi:MAG: hypothetical protein Phyf2KO_24120 [Phycisphaerales bacterium]
MKLSYGIACAAGSAFACGALGDIVEYSGSANITETGQEFVYTFNNVPLALSGGTLTVFGLGDYSIVPPSSETMTWDMEGIATDFGFNEEAFEDPNNVDLFQNQVTQTWEITFGDMAAVTADGSLTITLTNSSAVNFFVDQPDDFLAFRLSYDAIPAPGSAGVLAAMGLAVMRRRR